MKSKTMALAAIFAAAFAIYMPARADDQPADIPGAVRMAIDPAQNSQYLGRRYQKRSEGFALTPPAGSRMVERSGIDLVSYIVDAKEWGGSLEMVTLPKGTLSLKDFVDSTIKGMQEGQSFKGVQLTSRSPLTQSAASPPRADLSFKMQGQLGTGLTTGMREKLGIKDNTPDKTVFLYCQELIVAPFVDDKGNSTKFAVTDAFFTAQGCNRRHPHLRCDAPRFRAF